ncbi:22880_t:CDS:2, partial [Gigaspora margarita]
YRSRLLNKAEILLEKKNIDKVDFLKFLFTLYELITFIADNFNKLEKLMNELLRKKQEWIAKNVNVDFDTLKISKAAKKLETLREINSLTSNEQVFAIDNAILLMPEQIPISAYDDDLISDIQIILL